MANNRPTPERRGARSVASGLRWTSGTATCSSRRSPPAPTRRTRASCSPPGSSRRRPWSAGSPSRPASRRRSRRARASSRSTSQDGPAALPRPPRLQPRGLRLHDLHRQLGPARRGHRGSRDASNDLITAARPVRQPQLRGAHPPEHQGELPDEPAARRGVRARGPRRHRPDDRAARHGQDGRTRLPARHLAVGRPRCQQRAALVRRRRDLPAALRGPRARPTRSGRRSRAPRARSTRGTRRRRTSRSRRSSRASRTRAGAGDRRSAARARSRSSATRSRPTTSARPARSRRARPPASTSSRSACAPEDFNSYGSRRGNDRVMTRGTFANVRIKNLMVPGVEGGVTIHQPDGERMTIYDAAMRYQKEGVPLVVFAGQEYGTGSSRDWAAKGTRLLGVRAVVAQSYERIHRSNLVGMGVLPLQFPEGTSAATLGLDGTEIFDLDGPRGRPRAAAGRDADDPTRGRHDARTVALRVRIDTPIEVDYYRHGGILPFVLRQLIAMTVAPGRRRPAAICPDDRFLCRPGDSWIGARSARRPSARLDDAPGRPLPPRVPGGAPARLVLGALPLASTSRPRSRCSRSAASRRTASSSSPTSSSRSQAMGARVEFGDGGPDAAGAACGMPRAVARLAPLRPGVRDPVHRRDPRAPRARGRRRARPSSGSAARRGRSRPTSSRAAASQELRRHQGDDGPRPRRRSARLLDLLADVVADVLSFQIASGARAVQLFDTWAGELAAEDYREWALPAAARAIARDPPRRGTPGHPLRERLRAPRSRRWRRSGADVLSIDWRTAARRGAPPGPRAEPLQGNLDPALLLGDARGGRRGARARCSRETGGGRPHREPRPRHPAGLADRVRRGVLRGRADPLGGRGRRRGAPHESRRTSRSSCSRRYNVPGPRYTSYPTAPDVEGELTRRRLRAILAESAAADRPAPLSLYFHLPFCEKLCYFCGCTVVITGSQHAPERAYLDLARAARSTGSPARAGAAERDRSCSSTGAAARRPTSRPTLLERLGAANPRPLLRRSRRGARRRGGSARDDAGASRDARRGSASTA